MLLHSAVSAFGKRKPEQLKHWKIAFRGEPAIDRLGVRREFFTYAQSPMFVEQTEDSHCDTVAVAMLLG